MTRDERERLRAALAAPGFDEVRFAALPPLGQTLAGDFRAWLEAGHYADMDWIPRTAEKRADARLVLPGARTVIMLGVNYLPVGASAQRQQRWAKYALWSDYHDTINRGLREGGAVLEKFCGLQREDYRVYVDAGPVLERGWAAAAGVGWQGKNAMLISRTHGNWLFLAAIVARCEIPADEALGGALEESGAPPVGLHCGTCTRCLEACPTQAFPRPGWVDARRCISYHTIENRGIIPRELRAQFGGRVFGCDVCLDVCPWNRFAQAARSALLIAREELVGLSLLDLLAMDEARFREVFRKTPVKRVKLAGLLRNACIAAGNWHETREWHFGGGENLEAVAAAVERLCTHESPIVRAHAVWAVRRLVGEDAAARRLATVRECERDPLVLVEWEGGAAHRTPRLRQASGEARRETRAAP